MTSPKVERLKRRLAQVEAQADSLREAIAALELPPPVAKATKRARPARKKAAS